MLDDRKGKPAAARQANARTAHATPATPGPFDAVFELLADKLAERVLERMVELLGETRESEGLLTVDQLVERLQVSERTIRTLRKQGLPTIMVGDSPRFVWVEVLEFLRENPRG